MRNSPFPFLVVSYVLVGAFMWFITDFFGGWTGLLQVMGTFGAIGLIAGGFIVLAILPIYFLTVYRASRYAKKLTDAGYYGVEVDKQATFGFATMVLTSILFTGMGVWLSSTTYDIYSCIQAGECYKDTMWYVSAIFMNFMFWVMALLCFVGSVSIWKQSFLPLKEFYEDMLLSEDNQPKQLS